MYQDGMPTTNNIREQGASLCTHQTVDATIKIKMESDPKLILQRQLLENDASVVLTDISGRSWNKINFFGSGTGEA